MSAITQTDAEILESAFKNALYQADEKQTEKIIEHLEILHLDPSSQAIIKLCEEFYREIKHLLIVK